MSRVIIFLVPGILIFSIPCYADQIFKHGYEFQDCADCPKMIVVKGDMFLMGSSRGYDGRNANEGPRHKVMIRKFAVGRFEITFDEWDACVNEGGCNGYRPRDNGWSRGRRPVIWVSWDDAKSYVKWLRRKTGKPYRLLTEAEWEYVAGAKKTTPYWWGTSISIKDANYYTKGEWRRKTVFVDRLPANPFGLHNVHGNVWEWVEDCYHKSYRGAPRDGSAWLSANGGNCKLRVLKGGSWLDGPEDIRTHTRARFNRNLKDSEFGFRVARTLPNDFVYDLKLDEFKTEVFETRE